MLSTERVKSEQYDAQCKAVSAALEKLDKVLETATGEVAPAPGQAVPPPGGE